MDVVRFADQIQATFSGHDGRHAAEQLIAWFQGYDLPLFRNIDDQGEEPYHWILRALECVGDRDRVERAMAACCALIMRDEPDVRRPGKRPEQVLENLLYLSAGLARPDLLAGELKVMFDRRALFGEWSSGDLRSALRTALIFNQVDRTLEEAWRDMLEGRRHPFLGGTPFDGYEGILHMPESLKRAHEPLLEPIEFALVRMARYFGSRNDRERNFSRIVEMLTHAFPDRVSWKADLTVVRTESWPEWATRCFAHCVRGK